MKKALVMTFVLVLGLGAAAFAGPLSGSWESELTVGFRDVVVTDPGASFTIPGNTYEVSQGTVTIGDQVVTGTYQGSAYSVTVPGGTYWVGPWDLTLFEGGLTLDVENGVVTVPSQEIDVELPDGPVEVTFDGFSFELPIFEDKEFNPYLFVAEKTIDVEEPDAIYMYADVVDYHYVVQSGGVVLLEGDGTTTLEELGLADAGVVPFTTWQWEKLCWDEGGWAELILPGVIDTSLFPEPGKHLQVDFPDFEVKVKCADLADPWILGVLGRTATGFDQNNNEVTVTLYQHDVELDVIPTPEVTIPNPPNNWAYATEPFDEQHWLIVKIEPTVFDLVWPDWPRCCTSEDPRPYVYVQWLGVDTAVYQYTGIYDNPDGSEIEEMKTDVEANGEDVLDKIGFGFLDTEEECYEVDTNGQIVIPQGDIAGTFLLGSYIVGTETLSFGPFTLTGTYEGQDITITIPEQTDLEVTGGTVTIPETTLEVPADSIVIPDYSFTITVDDQDIDITVPGGTYAVSAQTVTIPSQTINIPGWTQTITKVPTLGFTSTLIVDYTVGGWVFNSTSKFDDTGWIAQSFAATGVLGAFSLDSSLIFNPAAASFTSWDSTGSVSIAGVALDAEFYLTAVGSGSTFGASGGAGDLSLAATVYFNMDSSGNLVADEYCFCFSSIDFDISFPFTCIDLVDISLGFSTAGFDGVTFSTTGIAIPNISWLTFDVDLTFATGVSGKTMTITPNLNFGTFTCITIYGELLGTFPQITGYNIYGIGLTYTWNGVTFSSLSALAPGWYVTSGVALDDEGSYWEAFTISSEADACCGGLFDFSVNTFFDKNSAMLFDWGESSVKLSMGLGSNYTGWTGLVVKDTGFDSWTLGFKVTW